MTTRTRMETILVDGVLVTSRSTVEISRYNHDCDTCIFMGNFEKYDLYFCPTSKSLIARYGEYGDYKSHAIGVYISIRNAGMSSEDDPLRECLARLEDMGVY